MKKSINILVLLICFSILFNSCNEQKSQFKVGFLFSTMKSKRWGKEKEYFVEKIKESGGLVIVKVAERDELKQYQQALELIDEGIDILVINSVTSITSASIVREAHKKGIKVVAYDMLVKNCDLDFYITFDGEKVGELLGRYMIDKIPHGNYVLLNGDRGDDNAVLFQNGAMKALKPKIDSKDINLIYSGYMEEWSGANSAFYIDKIIECSNVKIDGIISTYDGLTDGIASVLKSRNLTNKIPVTGQDAEIAACNRILNGEQLMTVYKPGKTLAYKCAEVVIHLLKKESIPDLKYINNGRKDVPSLILDPISVDKNNLQSTVVADGFWTMDEITNYKENTN